MKVTEQQLIVMHQTLIESLAFAGSSVFTYNRAIRGQVADEVFAQSNTTPLPVHSTEPTEVGLSGTVNSPSPDSKIEGKG